MKNLIRTCRFTPYRKGMGPIFTLKLYDLNKQDSMGKYMLGYELIMTLDKAKSVLFAGEDFHCSPCYSIDSNNAVEGIMGFLTLKEGDTDDEYFENYTKEQLEFCDLYAEMLGCEVSNRFCDGNGNVK